MIKNIFKWILLCYQDGETIIIHYFGVIPMKKSKLVKYETLNFFQYIQWLFYNKKQNMDIRNKKINYDEVIALINLLNKYSKSDNYNHVMKKENDASLKCLLQMYKDSFLDDILKIEKLTFADISIENPYVGDLLLAVGKLRRELN